MIPATPLPTPDWQAVLAAAVRDPHELLRQLGLDPHSLDVDFDPGFPLRAPAPWVARMQYGNPRDPLLLQTLPLQRELEDVVGFSADPVGDLLHLERLNRLRTLGEKSGLMVNDRLSRLQQRTSPLLDRLNQPLS